MPRYVITEVTEAVLSADSEADALQVWLDFGADATSQISVVQRDVEEEK